MDAHRGHGDQGRHPVANHGFEGNVREASSNGGSDAAPAHITEPVRAALRDARDPQLSLDAFQSVHKAALMQRCGIALCKL